MADECPQNGTVYELDVEHHELKGDLSRPEYYNTINLPRDGDKSNTPGACDCGYKHWSEGIEYDRVIKLWVPGHGERPLAFNITDNPFVVAQQFMQKNNMLRLQQRNPTVFTKIVETILKSAPEMAANVHRAPSPASAAIPTSITAATTSHFNPMSDSAPRNPGSLTSTQNQTSDDNEARREEARKRREKIERDAMKEKADKIKIMEQIENDRRVRQQELEDKKRQYAQPANHSSNNVKMRVDKDGRLVPANTVNTATSNTSNTGNNSNKPTDLMELFKRIYKEQGATGLETLLKKFGLNSSQVADILSKIEDMVKKEAQNANTNGTSTTDVRDSEHQKLGVASTPQVTATITKREIVINSSEPTTCVALRLHNGQTIKVTVNLSHTVQDLMDHVAAISTCDEPFQLVTGFPRVVLEPSKTVEEAKLAMQLVFQSILKQ